MSVGCFIGIRGSYVDEAQDLANEFIEQINVVLAQNNIPKYQEPQDLIDVYDGNLFGRSELDHHSAEVFFELVEIARKKGITYQHLALLASNPYRVVFLPFEFTKPFETQYEEEIFDDLENMWIGSALNLLRELKDLAPFLGISLENGELTDEVALQINEFELLFENDDCELSEDERTAWLLLFEGARLSLEHKLALSLAG